ncbi:hypothetical protein CV731_04595 [Listeria monocytogenes]|nr:hypothetical protein CV731_04595 [Listeria monocytogenes]AUH57589.1 hypothetical protein CV735_04590 [Listeria monocytogenes]
MFLWLKTLYRKRAVTWPFIFYTIIWTLSPRFPYNLVTLSFSVYIILNSNISFYYLGKFTYNLLYFFHLSPPLFFCKYRS